MSNDEILNFKANIKDLIYKPLVNTTRLKKYDIESFNFNNSNSTGIINYDENNSIAYSKWVSPKRTRSFPFARVYNTYHANKVVTIIPVIKDEGSRGDLDRINFITLSWLNLMNVYIILAWYDEAEYKTSEKITNQKFNNEYIKEKLEEIETYHLDAHHWNNTHFVEEFPQVTNKAIESYEAIEIATGAKLHNRENDVSFLETIVSDSDKTKLDLEKFKTLTLKRSRMAAFRESVTTHELEVLSDTTQKGILSITNQLGGEYILTCDEVIIESPDKMIIQESKNATSNEIPTENDIKDGLFKLILFSNIHSLKLDEKNISFQSRLKLTGLIEYPIHLPTTEEEVLTFTSNNNFSKIRERLILRLNEEALENNISIEFENNGEIKPYKKAPVISPLRYPGGKSRALKNIMPIIPSFNEFREPLVGGGSVFFEVKQRNPDAKFWINDLNEDLYSFWYHSQKNMNKLLEEVKKIKMNYSDGRVLFKELTQPGREFNSFEKAIRFFVLNRITFSGTVDSGGYSNQAFESRFTDSSIERLEKIEPILKNTKITNLDYQELVEAPGEDVFIFLDPPYLTALKSKLYGRNGDLHTFFDHEKFAEDMKKCNHKWLITYDNSPEVKELFSFANIYEWELQYGMNNYKQGSAAKGKELFISNYDIDFN